MSDTPVIYENPSRPLPEWARWMSKDSVTWAWKEPPIQTPSGWGRIGKDWGEAPSYTIPGPWQDSLRRIVRLSDPAYYVPENLYTDDEGFLPHDGGPMPEWVRDKRIRIKFADGDVHDDYPGGLEHYWFKNNEEGVSPCVAYRIVGEQRSENMKDRNENIGLEQRYEVRKLTNPRKALDCIVLEFDDPIAQKAIEFWANELCAQYPGKDYGQLAADVYDKLASYEYYNDGDGEQEDQRLELPNEGRNQEQEDVEEGLALLRKSGTSGNDDEGFLPHDGNGKPDWLKGKRVEARRRDGAITTVPLPTEWIWRNDSTGIKNDFDIIAYRIVGEQEEHPTEETDHRREAAERIVQFICESEPRQETVDAQEILAEHNLETLICVPHDVLVQLIENALDPVDMDEVRKNVGEQEKPPLSDRIRDKGIADPTGNVERLERHLADASASENGDDPEQFVSGDQVPFVDKPRSPSDASAEQRTLDDDKARERYEDERRHRNELAARTLTPVPGMDEWMHDVIREARRQRYREAALAPVFHGLGDKCGYHETAARLATDLADAIIEKEDSE